jgi:hypothetical protein
MGTDEPGSAGDQNFFVLQFHFDSFRTRNIQIYRFDL